MKRLATVRSFAMFRSILGFSLDGVVARRVKTDVLRPQILLQKGEEQSQAVDYFLKTLAEISGIPQESVVFVFDADREKLYDPTLPDPGAAPTQPTRYGNAAQRVEVWVLQAST